MTGTTHDTQAAEERLAEAQRVLDEHVTSSVDGLCLRCRTPGPCPRRETAVVTFSRYLRMPARRPGATRPHLIGIHGRGGSWFGPTSHLQGPR
jgi:hypothetical protein